MIPQHHHHRHHNKGSHTTTTTWWTQLRLRQPHPCESNLGPPSYEDKEDANGLQGKILRPSLSKKNKINNEG